MTAEIRAITIWQPWASLLGTPERYTRTGRPVFAKRYETRSWATDYRGALAIHAAAKPARETLREISDLRSLREISRALLPILYRGRVPEGVTWQTIAADLEREMAGLPRRAVICVGELKACHLITEEFRAKQSPKELALGDWTPGRYAWEIVNRRPCPPRTVNGAQGLWRWR